jgi:hypothetical protein
VDRKNVNGRAYLSDEGTELSTENLLKLATPQMTPVIFLTERPFGQSSTWLHQHSDHLRELHLLKRVL